MRRWLIAMAVMTAACAPEVPPVVFVGADWRTANGGTFSRAELEALRQSCVPQPVITPLDRAQPVPTPARANPIYRPGGEAIVNAPPIGIAAVDNPVAVATATTTVAGAMPVDDCLRDKGLVRGF